MKRKVLLLIVYITFQLGSFCQASQPDQQTGLDSLMTVWNDSSQPDTVRLNAIHSIAWDVYRETKPDSAFYFAQLEYDFADSIGNKKQMASALNTQAEIFRMKSDINRALEYHSRSLKIREQIGDQKRITTSLINMGRIFGSQGDFPKALDYLNRSLTIAEELGDKSRVSITLNNIGSIYIGLTDFDKANDYYSRSLTILEELGDKSEIANNLYNIGGLYKQKGEYGFAIDYYTRSLAIRNELEDKTGIASTLNNMGLIKTSQGDYATAIDYFTQVLTINEELGRKSSISRNLNNIGVVYADLGDNTRALDYYTRSLLIAEEFGNQSQVARRLMNIGSSYKALGEISKSIDYYIRSLILNEQIGKKDRISNSLLSLGSGYMALGDSSFNAGNIVLSKKQYSRALDYFSRSQIIMEEIGSVQHTLSLNNIGRIYYRNGEYETAISYSSKALELAQNIGNVSNIGSAAHTLYQAYKAIGSKSEALEMHELYIQMSNRITNEENKSEVVRQELKYKYEKQAVADSLSFVAEQEIQQANLKQTRIQLYASIAVLVLVIGIAFIFLRGREKQKKLNMELKNTQSKLVHSEKMASLGQLAAGVAHEINNPISFIKNTIQGIKLNLIDLLKIHDEFDTVNENNVLERLSDIEKLKVELDYQIIKDELVDQPDQIIEGVDRTTEIVDGLRSYVRLDEAEKKVYKVCEGLKSTINIIKHQVPDGAIMKIELCDLPEFECFPGKLNQVFMNILMNSLQALKEKISNGGGLPENEIVVKSYVESRQTINYAVIEISDTGLGMTEEVKNKIFDPFFTTKEVGEGTGLGLSMSYKIIEEHEGTINVISEINKGSKFVIYLPIK